MRTQFIFVNIIQFEYKYNSFLMMMYTSAASLWCPPKAAIRHFAAWIINGHEEILNYRAHFELICIRIVSFVCWHRTTSYPIIYFIRFKGQSKVFIVTLILYGRFKSGNDVNYINFFFSNKNVNFLESSMKLTVKHKTRLYYNTKDKIYSYVRSFIFLDE